MKCPIDGSELVMSERQGIEIDYCPKLPWGLARPGRTRQDHRAVSVFHGPVVVRSAARRAEGQHGQSPYSQPADRRRDEAYGHEHDDHEHHDRDDYKREDRGSHDPGRGKRRSLLGNLFDFGD